MLRAVLIAVLSMVILFAGQSVFADEYDDCKAACVKGYPDCIAQITEVNYDEVQEAKAKCETDRKNCIVKCHMDDANPPQVLPDKTPQEPKETEPVNGIKTYEFK